MHTCGWSPWKPSSPGSVALNRGHALLTGVVFLLMYPQVLLPGESFAAVLAGKWPLAGVDALVRLQVTRLREAFPTLSAAVRPLAGVHAYVRLQAPRGREAFAAVGADEASLPAVSVQVQRFHFGGAEAQRQREAGGVQVGRFVEERQPGTGFEVRSARDGHHAGQAVVIPRRA